jgi:hypothetical protein
VVRVTEIVYYCETCDRPLTFREAWDHPNGLGGHVVSRWEVAPELPALTDSGTPSQEAPAFTPLREDG